MAIRTYDILLDSYNSTMPEPIVGRQGDKNGAVTLHVTITDRGTAVDLTGQSIYLMAETAKGTAVVADNDGVTLTDAVNGKFDYAIPNALWSEAGKITKAYFSLNNSNGQQTTYDLIFIVKKAIDISQDKADDYITVIDGTVRDLQSKVDAIYATYQAGNFYSKAQTDDKDAATLASAKSYTDYVGSEAINYNLGDGMHWIAHRGNNSEYPENSLMAFKMVTRHWGIESDTSVTSDGKWVIMHDDTVDRMTNGTGKIADLTYDQFRALKFDAGPGIDLINDDMKTPPSMEEFFQICKANSKVPVMEIKSAAYTAQNYDDFVGIVKKCGLEKSMIVISFSYEALQEVKKRLPYINVSWLTGSYSNDEADKAAALGINSGIDTGTYNSLTAENIGYAHNLGLKLGVWTPSDDTDRETFKQLGVDYVTTNSLSGDLRFARLTLDKSWANLDGDMYSPSYVEEIAPGVVHVLGLILTENKDDRVKGTTIAYLPEWATPYGEIWNQAIVRTDGGLIISTVDLVGRKSVDFNGNTAALKAGIAWDTGSRWVSFNFTYHV